MEDLAIEVRGLRKSYGSVEAVRGIDLSVRRGQVFALLGPNGAGKTTTVEVLEGYRKRSAGTVTVLGLDPAEGARELKQRIGIVLQETGVNRYLTVAETIDQFRGLYPDPLPLEDVIGLVELEEKRDVLVRRLSGGQQRRLDVAVGLAGNPDLLFLDEPTTGFDPSARRNAWKMIKNLRGLGKTILLTTHYMDEAQNLADRVAIIDKGVIVAEGTPETIGGDHVGETTISFTLPETSPPLPDSISSQGQRDESTWRLLTPKPLPLLHELTAWALDNGVELEGLRVAQPSLEDTYLELTRSGEQPT